MPTCPDPPDYPEDLAQRHPLHPPHPPNPEVKEARLLARAERTAYREAANALYPNVTVGSYAHVQTCEGGAYVECTVWVPKEKLYGS